MEVFATGLGLGIAVAAPVGPIGLLCIRQTLTRGWAAGTASGIGAAVADGVYGMMVATGISATGLLSHLSGPMTLGGGLLIALLGASFIKAFFRQRSMVVPPPLKADTVLLGTFGTSFVLTLSNPMTILVFLGFVAGLGPVALGDPSAPYRLVAGVFFGSALWWLGLVSVTTLVRKRMTHRVMNWFNLISGTVLLLWGLWIMGRA